MEQNFKHQTQHFSELKLQLLKKSKPSINLSLLSIKSTISRNFKIELNFEYYLKNGMQGITKILNSIISQFGNFSIFDFRTFSSKNLIIFFRFSSLKSARSFSQNFEKIEGILKANFLEEICSYHHSDKVLFISNKGYDLDAVFNVLRLYGEIEKFKKVSMKKVIIQFDSETSLCRIMEAKRKEKSELRNLFNDLSEGDSFVLDCCYPFENSNNKFIFFDSTNPFKLRQQGKLNKENVQGVNFGKQTLYQNLSFSKNVKKVKHQNMKFDSNRLNLFTQNSQNKFLSFLSESDSSLREKCLNKLEKKKVETRLSSKKSLFEVNLQKIKSGMDGRTTFMIRNIPNAYLQKEIVKRIDHRIKGLYDFFYLPIDFVNHCNLGYAFINVINLKAAEELLDEFDEKKWPLKKSSKICSVKYARIQGRNSLINHFKKGNLLKKANGNTELIPHVLPNNNLDFLIF